MHATLDYVNQRRDILAQMYSAIDTAAPRTAKEDTSEQAAAAVHVLQVVYMAFPLTLLPTASA